MGQLSLFDSEEPSTDMVLCAHDHAAVALLPFSAASSRSSVDTLRHSYQVLVDEKLQRIDIRVEAGAAGLPTQHDQLVFLALLQLSLARGTADQLRFKRTEVFELLGWQERSDSWNRFRQTLERLTSLTIFVKTTLAARSGKEYADRASGAHLIDDFQIASGYDSECQVSWGHIVREAFRLDDFKRLDWSLVLRLDNPLTVQLYRLLDRVVLAGGRTWQVGWKTLGTALGMAVEAYARPAMFARGLEPHFQRLIAEGVLERVEYQRGGTFVFQLSNYVRAELRRVLARLGVYDEAARQLVAGYDEVQLMVQCDCYQHGARKAAGVGYLVQAIREGYAPVYASGEDERFNALIECCSPAEVKLALAAAQRLGARGDELRAVVRFILGQGLDPERI